MIIVGCAMCVVCRLLIWCMLSGVCCMLLGVCCFLCVVCCCSLCDVCRVLFDFAYLLYVPCCSFASRVVRCVLMVVR